MTKSLAAFLIVAACFGAAAAAPPEGKIEELKAKAARVEQAEGAESVPLSAVLANLAEELEAQSKFAEAEPLRRRALAIREKVLGPWHPETATAARDLAAVHHAQAAYAQAEPLYKRAVEIREKSLGVEDPAVAEALGKLGELYLDQSRFEEAETVFTRSLAIREKALGPNHRDVGEALNNMGKLYIFSGRDEKSEPLYQRSLVILRAAAPDSYEVAMVLNNLAELYGFQGRDKEAEPLFKESLALLEKALHPEHPDVAVSLSNLARLYLHEGRDREAEPLFMRSLAIREKVLGPKHPDVTNSLQDLAFLHQFRGHYNEADPLLRRIIDIREEALGPANHDVGTALNSLGMNFSLQKRHEEAASLFERALVVMERSVGLDHSDVGSVSSNLAGAYTDLKRYAEAEPLYQRSIVISEKTFGKDNPETAIGLNNLGELYRTQGRLTEAEVLLSRSLAIREKGLPAGHPLVAQSLNNLAWLYESQGRSDEARERFLRSIAMYERSLGPEHPDLAYALYAFANFEELQDHHADALALTRRAAVISRARVVSGAGDEEMVREAFAFRSHFYRHIALLWTNPARESAARVRDETFEVGQLIQSTGTAYAVAGMAARFAAGDDALAGLVKQRQDAAEKARRADADVVAALSREPEKRNAEEEHQLHARVAAQKAELARIDAALRTRFPRYQLLTRPEPLSIDQAQRLVKPREALIAYSISAGAGWMWIVRRDTAVFLPLYTNRGSLAETIGKVRAEMQLSREGLLPSVDTARLHRLYQTVFSPAVPYLDGIHHVMVVPAGPLESLPFAMLIASEPKTVRKPADYRSIDWIAKHYAISVLPSVGSLRALREFARPAAARRPFAGFGDPQLTDEPRDARSRNVVLSARNVFGSVRGSAGGIAMDVADVAKIRSAPSLPETADELRAMAQVLHGGESSLHLRQRATETEVKRLDLSQYRVVAFATHGVTAGELSGVRQPGLLLTPPPQGSPEDDGYLSAGEIARLKMNADWVLLSACNTAAADGTPDAEGLSGLAKAFFHAGSRSLLVSHWPIASEATVPLTTTMLREYRLHPAQGKAEAHRKAMLGVMGMPTHPEYAHPFFWAPFVIVGEGG